MAITAPLARISGQNKYDRLEWAGAFGDLGTLIPFLVAYISLLKMDPFGVLLSFGTAKICSGLFFKTPFPIQPMNAVGAISTTQAVQTAVVTPQMVYGAGLATGLIWLLLGATGATRRVANVVGRPVALGIVLGLGFSFMLDGIKMMAEAWWLSGIALVMTLALFRNKRVPVMFLLLILGAVAAVLMDPRLLADMRAITASPRMPSWPLSSMTWNDVLLGTALLALPQVPLTLGNAIIAITEENNNLFPDRPVTERKVAVSTGLMNLVSSLLGGIPMCHGAGGMAGHVAFGARTGGSLVILGSIMVVIAVLFSGSIETLFKIFPAPVLGVILFFTGAQLALGTCDANQLDKNNRFVLYTTAAFSIWNIGIAFVFGTVVYQLLRRGAIKI